MKNRHPISRPYFYAAIFECRRSLQHPFQVRRVLLSGIFWMVVAFQSSQAQPTKNSTFQRLQEGLSHQVITCIYQDHQGFMWFGTQSGLNRYDGRTMVVYQNNQDDTSSISHNIITSIMEDRQHNLWIGTATGLNRYNREKNSFEFYYLKKDKPIYVTTIHHDYKDRLWIGTSGSGLYVLDEERKNLEAFTHNGNSNSILSDFVTSIFSDRDHNLWIGTRSGLDLLGESRKEFIHFISKPSDTSSLSHSIVSCINGDRSGNIWIGTYGGGVNKLKRSGNSFSFERYKSQADDGALNHNYILCLLSDRQGDLWVGTENGGLKRLSHASNQFEHFHNEDGNIQSLSSNSIWSLYEDNNGLIWIGNYNKGLNIYGEIFGRFRWYQRNSFEKNSLAGNSVRRFSEDTKGNLWIATDGGGISCFNIRTREFSQPIANSTLTNKAVQTILYDTRNGIWIGTWAGGLDRYSYSGKKIRNYRFDGRLKNGRNNVKVVYEDRRGRIWVGTSGSGLFQFNAQNDSFQPVVDSTGTSNLGATSFINAILEDDEGTLWIGTSYGLVRIEQPSGGRFSFTGYLYNSPPHKGRNYMSVNVLFEDSKHNLWLGTGDDLTLFDKKTLTFTTYNQKQGLPETAINGILEEAPGILWVSTNKGIFRFNTATGNVHNFSKEDGLGTSEFYPGSCLETKSGELFFGGTNGFISFNPGQVAINRSVPPVYIVGFNLLNSADSNATLRSSIQQQIATGQRLVLSYDQTSFAIEFSALNFIHPQKNKFSYMLEGFDRGWKKAGGQNTAIYTNLDPGDYVFKVMGSNNEGIWNNTPATLRITIHPPFWKTTGAYIIYLVIFITLVWIFIRQRVAQASQAQKLRYEHEHRIKMEELHKTRTQFFTNLSHELRTPLSLILAPLRQAICHSNMDPQARNKLHLVYANAEKLYGLVDELIDFTQLEEGRLKMNVQEHDCRDLAVRLFRLFIDEAKRRGIGYRFACEEEAVIGWFDKSKMEKVIINLLQNAFKFTPDGGTIVLSLAMDGKTDDEAAAPAASQIVLSVTDNGSGISEKNIPRIFDRFFQSSEEVVHHNPGIGIGLSLVKELVELHHGSIRVESEKCVRTHFEISLPASNAHPDVSNFLQNTEEEAAAATIAEKGSHPGNTHPEAPLILIIEDNFALRAFLASVLSETYRVIEASNGKDGYDRAVETVPDLIVCDVLMPLCTGTELCRMIKTDVRTSHIPVVLLTAKFTSTEKIEGFNSGADAYITKPFDVDVLTVQISQLIKSRRDLYARFSQDVYFRPQKLSANALDTAFIEKFTTYVLENLQDHNLGVETIAEALNLSRSNLFRKIKGVTGKSVIEFIRIIRLKEALKLMEEQRYAMAEIAYLTGFKSPAYFTKTFREHYGKPPSDFLKTCPVS